MPSESLLVGAAFAVSTLWITQAAAPFVYPAKGQTPEQQAADEGECHTWAVRQSGYDPATAPAPIAVAPKPVTGSGARVGGAVVGAGLGSLSGNAGEGAAIGAVSGGVARRAANRREANAQTQAMAAQSAAGQGAYGRARAACLSGRGYSLR
jgi:hypothetical protein